MEHRKRSRMQHKVEISSVLRIAMANNKNFRFDGNEKFDADVTKTLAVEALKSLNNCDHCVGINTQNEQMIWIF